ncbi:MAG TPA: phosphoglycerate mutase family protein [Thermoanaerobaculia bacterium]|nr:phosphoglycerate mutase family protein [Thermoanaerobaculia bacterium]
MKLGLAVTLFFAGLANAALAQTAIILVRHAEKASDANEPGVPLSAAGRARADRLAQALQNAGITGIYATETDRARQTAEPLARARKLEVRAYAPRDADGKPAPRLLVDRLKKDAPSGVVLVVGHSNTVPEILAALGHDEKIEIPSTQYDDLFLVVPREGAAPTVLRLKY